MKPKEHHHGHLLNKSIPIRQVPWRPFFSIEDEGKGFVLHNRARKLVDKEPAVGWYGTARDTVQPDEVHFGDYHLIAGDPFNVDDVTQRSV